MAEMQEKEAVKAQLDLALLPFRIAAAAWSGGVMLGPEQCDDLAYAELLQAIANTGDLPERIESKRLAKMIARGLGITEVPAERNVLYAMANSAPCVPALQYDLTFPEVFYATGVPHGRQGFHVVLGNPPWDRIRPFVKDFYAGINISVIDAPTKRERDLVLRSLEGRAEHRTAFEAYAEEFTAQGRAHDANFHWQSVRIGDVLAGRGNADAYCLFAEAGASLLNSTGCLGFVLPSAFHANEGSTGIRQLYLEKMALRCCYSFENRRKLFEIHSSFKFALVVASRTGPTSIFPCAFYLHDDEWLFGARSDRELSYTLDFIRRTGGEYLSLLELRSRADLDVADTCFCNGEPFGQVCERLGIRFGVEADMTRDAWRFTPTAELLAHGEDSRDPEVAQRLLETRYLVLHEGKTFWHYNDRWEERPSYLVSVEKLHDKPEWTRASSNFRAAYRAVASATNERTIVFHMLPAGCVFGNSAPVERLPWRATRSHTLQLIAVANTFAFDWTARVRVGANINQFILFSCPLPKITQAKNFLRTQALRLTCNHAGYAPLWREQFGDVWREPTLPFNWPVLTGEDERWAMRTTIDAVVADAYGLTHEQYAHVLSTFNHRSYPKAPELCLARFDELKVIGLEAFTRTYDPYWDIPLNDNLPQPVIDLPLPSEPSDEPGQTQLSLTADPAPHAQPRRRRTRRVS
jgi:hypothetical protein